jgi:hypothetical protein
VQNGGTITNSNGTFNVSANITSVGTATFNAQQQLWSAGATFTNFGTATFGADTGGVGGAHNLNIDEPGGSITFTSSQHLAGLTISSQTLNTTSAQLQNVALPFFPHVIDTLSLSISSTFAGSAYLDLGNNELIALATVTQIRTLLSDGQLRSTSLDSSHALGYADIGAGKTEVRYTLVGDANLSGMVDVGDLGALATFYGLTSGAIWSQGDFNNDGKVYVGDLGSLATYYGNSLAGGPSAGEVAAPVASAAAVPEPSMFAPLVGLASFIIARKRRTA